MPAPGAPKIVYQLDLGPARSVALAAAARAPVLAVVRADDVVIVDITSPLRPARSTPRALPQEVRRAQVVAADVSPDGKLLAVATEAGNQVMLLDLVPRGRAALAGALAMLPEVRQSTLVDVAFSPTGDTLWVLSGDTPRSRADGPQPTELRAIRLASQPAEPGAPRHRARRADRRRRRIRRGGAGRSLPLASGGAIRLPPERTTVFFSAAAAARLGGAAHGGAAAGGPRRPARRSGGARGDRGVPGRLEDAATVAITALARLGLPDLSFDGRWLLAPALAADGSVRVLATAVDGRPAPTPAPVDVLRAHGRASRRRRRGPRRSCASSREARSRRGARRVQGVGFRAATADEARPPGRAGWVRNQLDGSVEVDAEGAPPRSTR